VIGVLSRFAKNGMRAIGLSGLGGSGQGEIVQGLQVLPDLRPTRVSASGPRFHSSNVRRAGKSQVPRVPATGQSL
jgi:ABC-type sugar transport system ATPase subunit